MKLPTPTLRLSLRVALSPAERANVCRSSNSQMCFLGVGSWLLVRLGVVAVFLGVVASASPAAAQGAAAWPTEPPPRPLAARQVKFPPYEIRTLPNGLQVIAVSHHEQPSIAIRLLVRAGAAQDPERKAGVAYLTSHLIDQGTRSRSAEQIAEDID